MKLPQLIGPLSVSLLTGVWSAGPAFGQPQAQAETDQRTVDATGEQDVSLLVDLLDSPDFAVREGASELLARTPDISLRELETELIEGGLSAEQHTRLLAAARARFNSSPRPAMGVSLGPLVPGQGMMVEAAIEGFDAARMLKPGDMITVIGGMAILGRGDLQNAIISREADEEIPVELIRAGQKLTVQVTLGRWSELPNAMPLRPSVLDGAWQARSRAVGLEPLQPRRVPSGLGLESWSSRRGIDPEKQRVEDAAEFDLTAGGEPRQTGPATGVLSDEELRGTVQEQSEMMRRSLTRRTTGLSRDIANLQRTIDQNQANIDSGRFTGDRAALANRANEGHRQVLSGMQRELERLEQIIENLRRGG